MVAAPHVCEPGPAWCRQPRPTRGQELRRGWRRRAAEGRGVSCPPGRPPGRSCAGGGSAAAARGEGKANSCRAAIMRRVGVAGQLRPCPSPTGTICDQAQLCLPYQPFRSDFPTTSPSRRPRFLTARGRHGAAWHGRTGTAGWARHSVARQDGHGTTWHSTAVLVHVGTGGPVRRAAAQPAWQGVAWLSICSLAQTRGSPPLAAAPLPGITRGMRFSHRSCPDLQLQHRPDLLSTGGDPAVQPSPAAPAFGLPRSCQ